MNNLKKIIFSILSIFCVSISAQNFDKLIATYGSKNAINDILRCGSHEYDLFLNEKYPRLNDKLEFEYWLKNKSSEFKKNEKRFDEIITIPIVVHVIHNGSDIGSNGNISDSQIISQITTLNQDYRKMPETRGWNDNEVGADIGIEFTLAQQTPDGNFSNGIDRVEYTGLKSVSFEKMQNEIKPATQWDPNRYLNIWVVPEIKSGTNTLLGYAQFPEKSNLPGLEDNDIANTDGVVIWSKSFGNRDYDDGTFDILQGSYGLGRTTTHEIGHFFGLRHIWGDSNICEEDDFCEDTPPAIEATNGCPNDKFSCGSLDMIQNYMDYTYDACMNIFTQDQKNRILTVIQNSPRRKSLLNSNVSLPPQAEGLDAHINKLTVFTGDCDENIETTLEIQNRGEENLTNINIKYDIADSNLSKTYEWRGNLSSWETTRIELPTFVGIKNGNHTLSVNLIKINKNENDDNLENNSAEFKFDYAAQPFNTKKVILKLKTDNYGKETSWKFINKATKEILYESKQVYENNKEYEFSFDVNDQTCYEFHFMDTGKDGICCSYGEGFYKLFTETGEEIISGGKFTKTDIIKNSLRISNTLNNNNLISEKNSLKHYPNPVKDLLHIENNINIKEINILDVNGRKVYNKNNINKKEAQVNIAHLNKGLYIVNLITDEKINTFKIIKK